MRVAKGLICAAASLALAASWASPSFAQQKAKAAKTLSTQDAERKAVETELQAQRSKIARLIQAEDRNQYGHAIELTNSILQTEERTYGPRSLQVAGTMTLRAQLQSHLGQYTIAASDLAEALRIVQSKPASSSEFSALKIGAPEMQSALYANSAINALRQLNFDEAVAHVHNAFAVLGEVYSNGHQKEMSRCTGDYKYTASVSSPKQDAIARSPVQIVEIPYLYGILHKIYETRKDVGDAAQAECARNQFKNLLGVNDRLKALIGTVDLAQQCKSAKARCVSERVFFATNRQRVGEEFSGEWQAHLNYGEIAVPLQVEARPVGGETSWTSAWRVVRNMVSGVSDLFLPSRVQDSVHPRGRPERVTHVRPEEFNKLSRVPAPADVVFVHGFNHDFGSAVYNAAGLARDIRSSFPQFKNLHLFSWPSAGRTQSYAADENNARRSGLQLAQFLGTVAKREPRPQRLVVIAHSMGNLVALEALRELADPSRAELRGVSDSISHIVFVSPDVDKEAFTARISSAEGWNGKFTLLVSDRDWALWASGKPRAQRIGLVKANDPSSIPWLAGGRTIDVSFYGDNLFGFNHGNYATNRDHLRLLSALVEKDQSNDELARLRVDQESLPSKDGNVRWYWRAR